MTSPFFHGTVLKADPISYTVEIAALEGFDKEPVIKGVTLSNGFGRMFGFKDAALPEPGSTVLCITIDTGTCYVLGTVVEADASWQGSPLRTAPRSVDGNYDEMNTVGSNKPTRMYFHSNNRPTDVVEGERVISNDFGIMMQLMQQYAALRASDLSQIQVHLLDDLVRIISHNFEHFHCMGQAKIMQDGKYLHAEYGATHLPNEAQGSTIEGASYMVDEQKTTLSTHDDESDCVDFSDTENPSVAVERLKVFVGALGDLFNAFVSVPKKDVFNTKDDVIPTDTGVLQVHAATDGGLHIRSAKEVFLEKTNWIRVPKRIKDLEDPEGDDGSKITIPVKRVFEFNDAYKKQGLPFLYAIQAQDYASFINEEINYTNYNSYKKDIAVPTDRTETSITKISEADANTPTKLVPSKAGVYILPNGGIMLKEAHGAAIILEGGNIYIQPAQDLFLQPMRHTCVISGGVTSIQSKKDLEIVSNRTSIVGYTGVDIFANKGDLALRAVNDVVTKSDKGNVYTTASDIYTVAENSIITTSKRNTVQAATSLMLRTTDKNAQLYIDTAGSCILAAKSSIKITADVDFSAAGGKRTNIGTEEQVIATTLFGRTKLQVKGIYTEDELVRPNITALDERLEVDITESLPRLSTPELRADYVFVFTTSEPEADCFITETIAQQDGKKYERTSAAYSFEPINKTTPFPNTTNPMYVVNTKSHSNSEVDAGRLYSKANDLDIAPNIELQSVSQYKFYTL